MVGHLPAVLWDVYLRWCRLHSAGVSLSIPPVAPADVPALFHPRRLDIYLRWGRRCLPAVLEVVYLRSSVLAGRCLPAVRSSTCGALGCIPPVVSPTLGGSRFEYTSGGSCGCACNVPPIDWDIYLRCKNISYRARYRPLAKSERKAQARKGHIKTAEVRGANGDS